MANVKVFPCTDAGSYHLGTYIVGPWEGNRCREHLDQNSTAWLPDMDLSFGSSEDGATVWTFPEMQVKIKVWDGDVLLHHASVYTHSLSTPSRRYALAYVNHKHVLTCPQQLLKDSLKTMATYMQALNLH